MLVDITNFPTGAIRPIQFTENLTVPIGYDIKSDAIVVNVLGTLTLQEHFVLEANVKTELMFTCGGCLKSLAYQLDFDIYEVFSNIWSVENEEKDIWTFTGKIIDFTPALLSTLLLNMPMRVTCSEDCKGLCPVCGNDLNLSDCGCNQSDIDPRWQGLHAFFHEKEV